jgi:phospholipid/cholesterol/gamma-HCH transport system substrate-binding protein
MQKAAPSIARVLTMVLFALSCFGLLLFLWLSFGGPIPLKPRAYQIKIDVPEAATLGLESDVRVAGVNVGKVRKKELAPPPGNRTRITIEIDARYAPIKRDARAILRQKTLLGESYIELTPGTRSAPNVPEGGLLPNTQVVDVVQLDEIFTAFDPQTRAAFRIWQQDLAKSFRNRGQDVSDVFGNLPAFATDTTAVLRVLNSEDAALRTIFRETANVFAAITRDERALRSLIVNSAQVFRSTAEVNDKIAETLQIFPVFLDESRLTLARLQTFSTKTRPLIQDLRPVARDLRPTLADLRAFAPDLKHTLQQVDPLIDVARPGLPALNDTLRGAEDLLRATTPFLEELNPILQWLALYQKTTADFIGQGAAAFADEVPSASGGIGHYLRQVSPGGIQNFVFFTDRSEDNRGNTYLDPLALAEARAAMRNHLKFPDWDCAHLGGEERASPPDDQDDPGAAGTPSCYRQGPIPFKDNDGADDRFPHVELDRDYD